MQSVKICLLAAMLAGSVACTAVGNEREKSTAQDDLRSAASGSAQQTRAGLADAAMAPLEDLNLKQTPIPDALSGWSAPYVPADAMTCGQIIQRLQELDHALGNDWDTPSPDERLRSERWADGAASTTLDVVSDEARGLIPFRGVVRRASGAHGYDKRYRKSFEIGAQQRSFLKGVGLAKNCPYPARPDFDALQATEVIQYRGDRPR